MSLNYLVFFLKIRPSPPSEPRRGRRTVGDPVLGMFVTGVSAPFIVRVGRGVSQLFCPVRVVGVVYVVGVIVARGVILGSWVGDAVGVGVEVPLERMPENAIFELGKNRVNSPSL